MTIIDFELDGFVISKDIYGVVKSDKLEGLIYKEDYVNNMIINKVLEGLVLWKD